MELIYVWINKYNCIHQQEFCFSPEYRIAMTLGKKKEWELEISTTENINIFKGSCITNITAVVGDNGAGKTTLLNYLRSLDGIPQLPVKKMIIQNIRKKSLKQRGSG
jgi:ABC-type lipoprotein export system ATPase subunit